MGRLHKIFTPPPVTTWTDDAQREADRKERKRLSENHYVRAQAMVAWLLATLVAVNGGALATEHVSGSEAWPFVVGVVLAILAGFATWQESQDRTGLHYLESLASANITDHGRALAERWRWRWPALRLFARWLNWGSLAFFVLGCLLVKPAPAS